MLLCCVNIAKLNSTYIVVLLQITPRPRVLGPSVLGPSVLRPSVMFIEESAP